MPNFYDSQHTVPTQVAVEDRRFPHEKLDAYRVARELVAFIARHRSHLRGLPGEAGPQLERALVSTLLNIAEAAGRQGVRDRARVFAVARGEACEAAAALEVALLYGALSPGQVAPARRRSQKSSKRPLSLEHRKAMIASALATVQCIPARLHRVPIAVLQPASTTPVEVQSPASRNSA